MRSIVLAASLLASLAVPAVAQGRHHAAVPRHAADFVDLAPARAPTFGSGYDPTSPRLNADPHPCAFGVACSY